MKTSASLAAALLLAATGAAQADVGLYSTGVDDHGALLATGAVDSHYTLMSASGAASAYAVDDAAGYVGFWLAPGGASKWITPVVAGGFAASNDPGAVDYLYQTTFDLSGIDLSSARITGLVTADNEVQDILLNGHSIGFANAPGYGSFTGFSIAGGFVDGLNTLAFRVGNYSGPTGLRAELSGTFVTSSVPEPAAWATLAAGALLLARQRKRSNAA